MALASDADAYEVFEVRLQTLSGQHCVSDMFECRISQKT